MRAASILLCIGLATGPSSAASAAPDEPNGPAVADRLEIEVAPSAGDVDVMRTWMRDAARAGMQDAGIGADEVAADRVLVVEIEGSLLDYRYSVGVRTPDGWAGEAKSASCSCKDQDLIAAVRTAVAELAPHLRAEAEVVTPSPLRPAGLGRGGKAGAALLGIGGAAAVGGIVMLALPPTWSQDSGEPEREQGRTLRLPGAIVTGAAVAVLAVGAVLLHRDRTKRRAAVAPVAGRRGFGVTAVVRF